MNYEDRDTYGIYKSKTHKGPRPRLMGADTLIGNDVYNRKGEDLGDIKEIMLDTSNGKVCYAVLSFGGLLGMGEKFFAVPWNALRLDTVNKRFELDVEKDRLKNAPGFDKDEWPDMADQSWVDKIHSYYGTKPQIHMNKNKIKGQAEEAEGKIKEAVGVLLDDKDMQIKGNVQKNVGKVKSEYFDGLKEDIKDK